MCESVMNHSKELFEEHFKSDMLSLVADKVPNVRLVLAQAMQSHFKKINSPFMYDLLTNKAVRVLQQDKVEDVRMLVAEIQIYTGADFENSSESSKDSAAKEEVTVESFLQSLNGSSRTSSVSTDGETCQMEQDIMDKSGVLLAEHG